MSRNFFFLCVGLSFPDDFKDPNCILLIQKRTSGTNHRGINKYIRKSFKKHYGGKFEMASAEEIQNDPKYENKKIYRFLLTDQTWTGGNKVVTTPTNYSHTTSHSDILYNYTYSMDFHLHDRLMEKVYPPFGADSNVPAKTINRFSVVIE
jgi:hypothetical protein